MAFLFLLISEAYSIPSAPPKKARVQIRRDGIARTNILASVLAGMKLYLGDLSRKE